MPISAYTAAALTLLLLTLSAKVSGLRLTHKVSFGDANIKELTMAVRAHGNTLEQSVLFVPLLYFVEAHAQVDARMVLALGAAFVLVRVLYCAALFKRTLPVRQVSHVLTLLLQAAAVAMIVVH